MNQNYSIFARGITRSIRYFAGSGWRKRTGPDPVKECQVPASFFGICAASTPEPACDDYIIARLKELDIRSVRVDYAHSDAYSFTDRFLKRLQAENFKVLLHVVQPRNEVEAMHTTPVQAHWREFLSETFKTYAKQVECFEIGSTCNRRKWSGYTPLTYLIAWQIAFEEARLQQVTLAAPNVTDFEPIYNIMFLHDMKRHQCLPSIQTDNLFVERATEPEAFDHKILGRRPAGLIRFNLTRKAQLLSDIGAQFGVPRTICTQVSWSLRRIARASGNIEEKQADYVARYCCLAAASGALDKVFWGPLIGQREGLIDDGSKEFPEIPHVTFYGRANGQIENYRSRPAFKAFQTVNRFIPGTVFQRKMPAGKNLEILEFAADDRLVHVAWTRDGFCALLADCYAPADLADAQFFTRDGQQCEQPPFMLTASPVYLVWKAGRNIQTLKTTLVIRAIRFANLPGTTFTRVRHAEWEGICIADARGLKLDLQPILSGPSPRAVMLRDSRNRVWSIPAAWDESQSIVVKQFKPEPILRRLLSRRRLDKGTRSWSNAQELLRRGINTPLPLAFLRRHTSPCAARSYYVCMNFPGHWSVREAFTAFSSGASEFQGLTDEQLFDAIAQFLQTMHARGIFFRDLSAGNLLFRLTKKQVPEFALIDTARARFYRKALGTRLRLCDLMRICHPLHWEGREIFIAAYLKASDSLFHRWMKIPFQYYDWKHKIKNALRRKN